MLRIHYHRLDGEYDDVGLWTWIPGDEAATAREVLSAESDDFGRIFRIAIPPGAALIGFIPRVGRDWSRKDGGDRFWKAGEPQELWLVSGEPHACFDRPNIAPRIDAAYLDGPNEIALKLSHAVALGRLVPALFQVRSAGGGALPRIKSVRSIDSRGGLARSVVVTLEGPLDLRHEVIVLANGYRPAEVVPRHLSMDQDAFHSDAELGAICARDHTIFRVFSPRARAVSIIVHDARAGDGPHHEVCLEPRGMGLWEATEWGHLHGKFYMVAPRFNGQSEAEAVDFYARCTTGRGGRAMIVDPRRLDPPGFRPIRRPPPLASPCDAVIYEMHIRDFTISLDSGVPAALRGTYLGAARRGTKAPGGAHTGIDHLVELGVTHVQLLPVQDFDNDEDGNEYNWGYMTSNFFSPEGWFSTNPRGPERIREFKELVKALHDAGIGVVMDVVYNHTGVDATFEKIAPGYYHRMKNDGTFWNGSGTGNEFRSEAPMGRKLILDSCRYWVEEYGVDGFRFDLMGLMDMDTLNALRDELRAVYPSILLYGEPWAATGPDGAGIGRMTYKDVARGSGIGCFNDHFRNDLKGSPDGDGPGYVQNASQRDGVARGLLGAIHDWAEHPAESIQYADCHDNLTLWDKIEKSAPAESEEERLKIQMLTVGILAVSQGVMFLHGGVEFARTKGGHHNSYDAPDAVNQFMWKRKAAHRDLFDYVRHAIALRRAHPVFRLATREAVENRVKLRDDLSPPGNGISLHLNGAGVRAEKWAEVIVHINPDREDLEFKLPPGEWELHQQGALHGETAPLMRLRDFVYVPARGMAVLARPLGTPIT